jgi:endonuclease/exonuclease/phosphatase family metal-dependent hydrolase
VRHAPAILAILIGGCSAEPQPIRVVSYNVKALDWTDLQSPTWPRAVKDEDLLVTLRAMAPDVAGLQETRRKRDGAAQADELAAALGLHAYSVTTTTAFLPWLQENAILSRHELLEQQEVDLGPDPTSDENRRFLYARLQLPNGAALHVGNVHDFTDATRQLPALQQIEAFLRDRVRAGDHLVWTGDFNFGPSDDASAPYGYVTRQLSPTVIDPLQRLGVAPAAQEQWTSPASTPKRRIDYIFVSPGITVRSYRVVTTPVPSTVYPDHLAVCAELEIPPP